MPDTVVAGSILSFVGAIKWQEYHLVVYSSEAHEVVILDDAQILQIIPIQQYVAQAGSDSVQGSFNENTATIAIASGKASLIYECEELFGQRPRWKNSIKASLNEIIVDSSWLNSEQSGIATSQGSIRSWDIGEQICIWDENIGHSRLECCSRSGKSFSTFNEDDCLIICINSQVSDSKKIKGFEATPIVLGELTPTRAWFVWPDIIAAYCANKDVMFLWKLADKPQLIASIPYCRGIIRDEQENCVKIHTDAGVYLLDCASLPAVANISAEPSVQLSKGDSIYSTDSRTYTWQKGMLRIIGNSYQNLASVTGPKGASSTACLSGDSHDYLSAGHSLFATDSLQMSASAPVQPQETQTMFVSKSSFLEASINTLELRDFESASIWKVSLPHIPISSSTSGIQAIVVLPNQISVFDLATGKELNKVDSKFQVQKAAHSEHKIAMYGYDHLEVLTIESMTLEAINVDVSNSAVVDMALATESDMLALATSSQLTIWKDKIALGSVQSNQIIKMAWSSIEVSHKKVPLLAVSTDASLQVYTIAARGENSQILLVSEKESSQIPHARVSMSWYAGSHEKEYVTIFNGQQLVRLDASASTRALKKLVKFFASPTKIATITDSLTTSNSTLPVYHPEFLLLLLRALKPQLVFGVIARSANQVRYAEQEEHDAVIVAILDPTLGFNSLTDFEQQGAKSSYEDIEGIYAKEKKTRLMGLTETEQAQVEKIATIFNEPRDLDPYAACALVLFKVFDMKQQALSYAWLSTTKPLLMTRMDAQENDVHDLKIWLDRDALTDEMEQTAKKEFAQTRDPTEVTLYYLALHKLPVLKTLWRISGGHPERDKTLKSSQNDFGTQRWRTAAQKNAYALMSHRRFLYAAAFFSSGDAVTDCCQILTSKLHNLDLAIGVARVYEGDNGKGVQFIYDQTQDEAVRFYLLLVMGKQREAVEMLDQNVATLFLYAYTGGQFDDKDKSHWKRSLESHKLSSLAFPLIDELVPKELPRAKSDTPSTEEKEKEETGVETSQAETKSTERNDESEWESRPMPKNSKPAPAEIQLEPDMSAFGF